MPANKQAIRRYLAIDHCLSHQLRVFSIAQLRAYVNQKLAEEGLGNQVSKRQLYEDIRFMESSEGFSAPIKKQRQGREVFYTYSEPSFRIFHHYLSTEDLQKLAQSLSVLSSMEGLPQLEWLQELILRLERQMGLRSLSRKLLGFDHNPDVEGLKYLRPLFEALTSNTVLQIDYQAYGEEEEQFLFHPYYLKQYNGRWFCLGYREDNGHERWNLALDRIKAITAEAEREFRPDKTDWEEHFYDIIGVTRPDEQEAEEVLIHVKGDSIDYILSKPLHPSQRNRLLSPRLLEIRLKLIPNYEFYALVLSYGPALEIVSPPAVRQHLGHLLRQNYQQYLTSEASLHMSNATLHSDEDKP